jgi:translation initiation factor IF-3
MFRGREISHPEVGQEVLDKALAQLKEAATIEKPPGMEGRFLTVILTPTLKKPEKKAGGEGPKATGEGPKPEGDEPGPKAPAPVGSGPAGSNKVKAETAEDKSEEKEAQPAAAAPKNEA